MADPATPIMNGPCVKPVGFEWDSCVTGNRASSPRERIMIRCASINGLRKIAHSGAPKLLAKDLDDAADCGLRPWPAPDFIKQLAGGDVLIRPPRQAFEQPKG